MTIGQRIKQLRLAQQKTQLDVCGEFITRNMLSRIENDSATPSLQTVEYLASRLGVSVGDLFGETPSSESGGLEELCDKYYRELLTPERKTSAEELLHNYLDLLNETARLEKVLYAFCIAQPDNSHFLNLALEGGVITNESLRAHLQARLLIAEGKISEAIDALNILTDAGDILFRFHIYSDLEQCYLKQENYKKAYQCSNYKQHLRIH